MSSIIQCCKRKCNIYPLSLIHIYIQRNACGGCFNRIPPQKQLEIKMHKKIIVCEYCGRILIDPALAGVQEETSDK